MEGIDFGRALQALKRGECVARAGWNGKKMFLWLQKGSADLAGVAAEPVIIGGVSSKLFDRGDNGTVTRMPHINMRAADGSTVVGWLASQTDMLATDWSVLTSETP